MDTQVETRTAAIDLWDSCHIVRDPLRAEATTLTVSVHDRVTGTTRSVEVPLHGM